MYRIRYRIIKPVLITEEGGEKTCMLSFDGYRCMYTQRYTRAKSQKHACHAPAGIKLALSCTVGPAKMKSAVENFFRISGCLQCVGHCPLFSSALTIILLIYCCILNSTTVCSLICHSK